MRLEAQGRLATTLLLAALVLGGVGRAVKAGEEHDFDVVDPEGVYYGKGSHPKKPAAIRADDVWAEIPEYKKILENDLDEDDPEYHLLMKKASERFGRALEKEAKRESYDMIAEQGAIRANTPGKEIPDATADMIELVTRD